MPEAPKQVFVERLVLLRSAAGQPTYESIERGAGRILDPGKKDQRGQTLTARGSTIGATDELYRRAGRSSNWYCAFSSKRRARRPRAPRWTACTG